MNEGYRQRDRSGSAGTPARTPASTRRSDGLKKEGLPAVVYSLTSYLSAQQQARSGLRGNTA